MTRMNITKAAQKSLDYRLELGSRTGRMSHPQATEAFKSYCPACRTYHMIGDWLTRYTDTHGVQYDYCQHCAPW